MDNFIYIYCLYALIIYLKARYFKIGNSESEKAFQSDSMEEKLNNLVGNSPCPEKEKLV